jgi:hypothetical protein
MSYSSSAHEQIYPSYHLTEGLYFGPQEREDPISISTQISYRIFHSYKQCRWRRRTKLGVSLLVSPCL